MITVIFTQGNCLPTNFFAISVSYVDPTTKEETKAINNRLLATKLSFEEVVSVLSAHCKDSYKLTIEPKETTGKHPIPSGYYETYCLDSCVAEIHRLRFFKTETIEEPTTVIVKRTVKTEL